MVRRGNRTLRRGFSLIEAVVVLALVGTASAAVVYWASNSGSVEKDVAAKAALVAVYEAQVSARVNGGNLLDIAGLQALDPARTYGSGPSTSPSTVSVAVDGFLVHAASSTGSGDCWMLRLDLSPSSSASPRQLWFMREGEPSCTALLAASLPLPLDGSGSSPDKPSLL
jgi:prepilin-type N-terminal cleavage/methylation domain-containing protein